MSDCKSDVKIRNLEKRIALLEERLAILEEKKWDLTPKQSPWTQPMWPTQPTWSEPNKCQKCGLQMDGVMGYVCSDPLCPSGLGPIICKYGV